MTIQQLTLTDASFLYNESASTPMHIAAVQVFDVPAARRTTFHRDLQAHYAKRLHLVAFFTRRAVAMPLGLDHPVWESCAVDLDHHIRQVQLPAPGSRAQLEAMIADLHAQPLDRNRPLWRYWVIEGYEGDKTVFYTKMHHSAIDGMAGQALLDLMYSDTPDVADDVVEARAEVHSNPAERMGHAMRSLVLEPWRQAARLAEQWDALRRMGTHLARGRDLGAYTRPAPSSPLNVSVGRRRSFAIGTLPLPAMRALAKAQGAKLNDVFMAVCAGALREHLLATGSLPPTSLLAGVPVSLREPGDAAMNNQVTMMLCSLATEIADPVERLKAVRDSAGTAKRVVAMTKELMAADAHVPGLPGAMAMLAGVSALLPPGVPIPAFCNVVISNVPGPRRAKFLLGARMLTHHPVSIAAHGLAVNLTVQSYVDRMDFAVTACHAALPDADVLLDRMLAAWEALHARGMPAMAASATESAQASGAAVTTGPAPANAVPGAANKTDLLAA